MHSENGTKPAKGTKFAPANIDKDEIPEGAVKEIPKWATVNGDGTIAVSPDAGVPEGDYNIPVKVTYPNGVEKVVLAPIHVGKKQITDSVDPKYAQDTVVKAGESGTVVAPKDADGNALPEGTKFVPGKDVPEWAKVNPDGSITVAPGKDVVPGDYKVPVVVTYPDGSTDAVEVPVKVTEGGKGRTDAGKPAWDDASTPADKTVVIPNKGGDVVEGTTVEVEGPGKAEIGADGSLKVTPSADAKPGDKIVAKVKDGEGNVIDTVTVRISENVRGNSRKVVRTIARTSIAKTGVQVFGYGAASAALLLAGVGVIAAARRCKED